MTIKQNGGKVIASGGFGCIFEPALKCENSSDVSYGKISKLMTSKYATDEYLQIEKYKSILNVIPNYSNYFLINDFELCKPDKLTKSDLNGYGKKCKALKKKGINAKNINKSLDKVMTINMPNGGIDVEQFVKTQLTLTDTNESTVIPSNIIILNNALIDLLINGIVPMNKLNVYHCDIKDANILVNVVETGFETRLIDWGMSFIYNASQNGISRKIYRRPFQYNAPFSSILFNKDFTNMYSNFLQLIPNPDYFQIREFVINYIFIWNDIRGSGHLSTINDIMTKLTIKNITAIKNKKIKKHFIEYDFTYYYIVEYISKIIHKYTINGSLELMTYLKNVFLKNVDIWGFTMVYIIFYETLYDHFDDLNHYQIEFITKIKYIIIHYLYESPLEPINISLLVDELTSLNTIIEKFNVHHTSPYVKFEEIMGGLRNKKSLQRNTTNKYLEKIKQNVTKTKKRR